MTEQTIESVIRTFTQGDVQRGLLRELRELRSSAFTQRDAEIARLRAALDSSQARIDAFSRTQMAVSRD